MNVERIKIDPAIIFWGERQKQKVTCPADISASDYFKLYSASGKKYAVWCEVDSSGSAPVLAGFTAVKVTLGATPTASQVATAVASAIAALDDEFESAEADGATVTIQDKNFGVCDEAEDGATSGFTFEVITEGYGGDIGYTSGDTEFTPTIETKELTAHQSGNSPLAELITKVAVERISLTLMEADKARIEEMFSAVGHSETPLSGTKVVGFGTDKVGGSLFAGAKKLVFAPKSKNGIDRTEDVIFWRAAPVPGSLKFSGTDERTLQVEFAIYPDPAIDEKVNVFLYGDWTQGFAKA